MGMYVGNTSSSGEPEVMMEIITIPIQLHSVKLEMPVGAPPSQLIKPAKIQIDIDAQSVVYWQGLPVSAQELDEKMKAIAPQQPQPEVHIRPNKDSQYAVFANVLSSSKRLGLNL